MGTFEASTIAHVARKGEFLTALIRDEADRLTRWPGSADNLSELSCVTLALADTLTDLANRIVGMADHCHKRDGQPLVGVVSRPSHREELAAEVRNGEHEAE